jgi:hypothetical protein
MLLSPRKENYGRLKCKQFIPGERSNRTIDLIEQRRDAVPFGIWPPYQALYFESMAFLTASAVQSVRELNDALEAWSSNSDEERPEFNPQHILNAVQNIIQHAAALGRYFGPSDENGRHAERVPSGSAEQSSGCSGPAANLTRTRTWP